MAAREITFGILRGLGLEDERQRGRLGNTETVSSGMQKLSNIASRIRAARSSAGAMYPRRLTCDRGSLILDAA